MEGGKLGAATNMSLDQTEEIKCEKCGGRVFTQGFMMRKVSELMTGTGKPGILPIPIFVCDECGHVNKEFLPEELK